MNRWFKALIIIVIGLSTMNLHTQPQVSYILPDIGAPGMNVYVEFVGPYNKANNFGKDTLYLNNEDDAVRVIPANPEDESKIKIGPVIVSWQGRMISTQVFINPDIDPKPNSTDALIVGSEFKIPLMVVYNGQKSNEQMFYIVQSRPYFDGTATPSETIFGEGNLGIRSPRGAMIFDSVKLANQVYNISKTDCDPNTDGNQGYLPFTLLVRGKLTGVGTAMISADAEGKNGGPGGGGGGGRFYDAFLFGGGNNGDNGGDGFVGGGAGGRNRNAMSGISDAYKKQGAGSGRDSNSLNGIPYPKTDAYESAAGSTGHPFGLSGQSCNDGNNCSPDGAYGAGSGVSQNKQGGSGAYGSNGVGVGTSGGKIHGNAMNIPLAGGSGGAGGNPNWPDAYSGNGGGGGGALSISADEVHTLRFSAKGADGDNSRGGIGNIAYGGSGSGGALNLSSKISIEDIRMYLDGGIRNSRRGGYGRHRLDGTTIGTRVILETEDPNFNNALYRGVSTDTSQFVKSNFTLTGTQALPGKNISTHFYVAPFDGDWVELSGVGFTDPANGDWSVNLSMINNSDMMCLVVTQDVPNHLTGTYEHEPIQTMSQAAANIFILDENPILLADSIAANMAITCIGYERFITTEIKNDDAAGGDLEFNVSNNNWIFGNNGFEIIEPLGDVELAPGESVTLKVRFFWSGPDITNIMNRWFFYHNDPAKQNPWIIDFKVGDAFRPRMEFLGLAEDFIFPDTRIGGKSTKSVVLRNIGESDLLIETIEPMSPPFYVVGTDIPLPKILKPGEEIRVIVEFRPTTEGTFKFGLVTNSVVTDTTCSFFAFQMLEGKGVESSIDVNVTEIDFGLVPWCDEREEIISIRNPSSASFTLTSVAVIEGTDPDAFVILNPKAKDFIITPDNGVLFRIKINGKLAGTGVKTAVFRVLTDVPDSPVIEVILKAEIVGFDVKATPNSINLGNVDVGFDINTSLNLKNNSRLPEVIKSVLSNNMGSFTFPNVVGDIITPNGGNYKLDFIFNTTNQSVGNMLVIAFDNPCYDTLFIPINVNYVLAKESAFTDSQKLFTDPNKIDTIDYGKFSSCVDDLPRIIEYTNLSEGRYVVLNESLQNLGDDAFSIVGSGLAYPDTIIPSPISTGAAQILFMPRGLPEGVYYAEYSVEIYINGKNIIRKIIVKGEVIDGDFDNLPLVSNFNTVLGLSDNSELIINNKGPYDIEIIGLIIPSDPVFTLSGNLLGVVIPAENQVKTNVIFLPNEIKTYRDSIVVKILIGGCEREIVFYLEGEGLPSKKLMVYIPDMIVEPTLNNFKLPIYGKLEKEEDTLEGFTIETLKITMHRSVFYPKNIIGGTLISSTLIGDDRVLEIKIDNINVNKNDSLIAEIEGATLLGDVDYTDVAISDIDYTQKALVGEITSSDGSMLTEICTEGDDRLLTISGTGSSVKINPNPVSDMIRFSIFTIEKGKHIVDLLDMFGRTIRITDFINPTGSGYEFASNYPTADLASGNYTFRMQTPSEMITLQFVILK